MSEEQKKKTTFEQSLARLERIVSEMEGGELSLGDMLKKFEEGRKLVQYCTSELESIRQRIEKVTATEQPQVESLAIDDR